HSLEGPEVFRAAVRIAAIVNSVCANKYMRGLEHFCPRQGKRKENSIAGRNIGNGYAGHRITVFGHFDIRRQRGTADFSQIEFYKKMVDNAEALRNTSCRLKLNSVPLSIIKTQSMDIVAIRFCNGCGCCRV